jgi:YnfA/UPF0060 family uncharacterized protein
MEQQVWSIQLARQSTLRPRVAVEYRSDADVRTLLITTIVFVLTACAEILGCYTVHLWLKAARSRWWLVPGAVSLGLFAWLLTLHPSRSAGRI